jgi:oligopeptidase B
MLAPPLRRAASAASLLLALACAHGAAGGASPPEAARKEHLEVWHGERFTDPWFWLRERENPEVRRYLEAENAFTTAQTRELAPFADALYREMLARIRETDLSVPERDGRFYYYQRTVQGLQYPIRCRRPAAPDLRWDASAPEEVLLDQNELAKGLAFLAIGAYAPSDDGARVLFTTDAVGFRQYRLFVKDLGTGSVAGPLAERVVYAVWAADGRTLFYVTEDAVTKRADTVWRLTLGGAAERVYEEKDDLFRLELSRTHDRKVVVVSSLSVDTWESRILPTDRPREPFRVVLPREKGHKYEVDHRDGRLYIRTNRDAKNFRIVTAPLEDPSPVRWTPFVEHRPDVAIEHVALFQDFAVVVSRREALQRLDVVDLATGARHSVDFGEPVYAVSLGRNPEFDTPLVRFTYQSFTTPPSVYDYDLGRRTRTLLKETPVLGKYDRTAYASERLWVTARDGTRIPVSVVYRKGFLRDGNAPLWLYGYGSYGYPMWASFDSRKLSLLDRGVAYAIAHVRGGGELGEPWHDDGMLMRKKNTFHDFVDVAQALVGAGWTSPARLLIEGGSAGGLLMGAVVNERPDLFRAVHAAVPFVDVMNTMMDASLPLTTEEYLEWGNPNERPAFEYMRSYSPYDNLARRAYPAILVTTSFHDSQVMYWEPAKYVAKLRALKTDASPLLLKVKLEPAGHGGASGRYDALRDRAFEMAWMLAQVGITR